MSIVAYAFHKWVEGFVLALSLMKAKFSNRSFFFWNLGCSLASPLGVVLYTGVNSLAEEKMAQIGPYFNAFACGTLLYVGVTEIVPEVFECDTNKTVRKALAKFFMFNACGGCLMLFLFFTHSCEHSHTSEGGEPATCPDGSCASDGLLPSLLANIATQAGWGS